MFILKIWMLNLLTHINPKHAKIISSVVEFGDKTSMKALSYINDKMTT